MALDRFSAEKKAYDSLNVLLQAAAECRALFEAARLPLPEPLRRVLGEDETEKGQSGGEAKVIVPPPPSPPRPPEWQSGWIALPFSELTPTSLVGGLLRSAAAPMAPKELLQKIDEMELEAVKGSVMNIGTRLAAENRLKREHRMWSLTDPTSAPVLFEGYGWGPASIFDKYEVAAHRRLGVLHLLGVSEDGLQIVQITKQLRQCSWLQAPVTKDLIKDDIRKLKADQKVRQLGHSGKWRAA